MNYYRRGSLSASFSRQTVRRFPGYLLEQQQESQPLRAASVARSVVLESESGTPSLLWAGFGNGLALQGAVQHGGQVVWGSGGRSSASQDPWVPSESRCSWAESRLDQERRLGRRVEAGLCPAPGKRGSGWRLSGLFRG